MALNNAPKSEYFIRVTPYDTSTLDDIRNVFEQLNFDSYVLSRELASRVHYHAYIRTTKSAERLRYQLKQRVGGQIYISGKQVEDQVRAIAYTIKDGSYIYKDIDVNTFLKAVQLSKPKTTFDDRIKEIKSRDPTVVTRGVVRAYKEFNRKPHLHHIESLVRYILLKNDDTYENVVVNKILDRL